MCGESCRRLETKPFGMGWTVIHFLLCVFIFYHCLWCSCVTFVISENNFFKKKPKKGGEGEDRPEKRRNLSIRHERGSSAGKGVVQEGAE